MKKIFSLAILCTTVFVFGQGIKFTEGNFKTLLSEAKKENKLLFIDAYTAWCGPCKLMAKNVFTTQEVGNYYNAKFINAKIDMEKGEGVEIAKKYNVKAFPTYLWVNGDGELVHTGVGYYDPTAFVKVGDEANDPTKQVISLKKKFDAGSNDPSLLKSYYKAMAYRDMELAPKIAARFFQNKAAKSAYTQEDVVMLLSSAKTVDDEFYKIYLRDKAEVQAGFANVNYDSFESRIKLNTVQAKAYDAKTKKLNEKLFLEEASKLITKEDAHKQLSNFKLRMALGNKDYTAYEKLALEVYNKPEAADFNELNSVAWNFFENVSAKTSLQKALEWAKLSVQKEEHSFNLDTVANIYNKLGDKNNAKIWAKKAIDVGKAKGDDVSDSQKLLDSLK